jgi:regulator of protease activity HflC (stomatin/prohibitin superfamily)
MPQFHDFLARFRPVGSPGAASRVGVAVDRAGELSRELGPVLTMLAATQAECERIAAQAARDARQIMDEARERAAAVAAEAAARADAARTDAAGETVAAARAQADRAVREADGQARRARRGTEQQISALVSDAVGLVRSLPREGWPA